MNIIAISLIHEYALKILRQIMLLKFGPIGFVSAFIYIPTIECGYTRRDILLSLVHPSSIIKEIIYILDKYVLFRAKMVYVMF